MVIVDAVQASTIMVEGAGATTTATSTATEHQPDDGISSSPPPPASSLQSSERNEQALVQPEVQVSPVVSPLPAEAPSSPSAPAAILERPKTRSTGVLASTSSTPSSTKKKKDNLVKPKSTREPSILKSPWKECRVHTPTLEELQSQSFSDYVRNTVLKAACLYEPEEESPKKQTPSSKFPVDPSYLLHQREMPLADGMAKVSLPHGFWSQDGIAQDQTGRGPQWQAGSKLGDLVVSSPMSQHIRGLAGVYEYIFTDQPSVTVSAFREQADAYRNHQVGSAVDEDENRMAYLERTFWKRLGPTMPPAQYGADQEGSLFGDDPASGWSVANLDSCLHLLGHVPGVTSPYLYWGSWASVFCVHTEDMHLLSINYLHAGAPKVWYAVTPGADAARLEALATFSFSHASNNCKEFLRHKRYLLSPEKLKKAGIPFTTIVQRPGEAVITFPGGYHWGWNSGFNVAEATNFAVPEWIPFGMRANFCLCRPDSVRIDMNRFISSLKQYVADQKGRRHGARLSWKEWSAKRDEERSKRKSGDEGSSGNSKKKKVKQSDQQRKKEFWIEVVKPMTATGTIAPFERKKKGGKKSKKKKKQEDEWRLAQPVKRREIQSGSRVLVILPTASIGSGGRPVALNAGNDDDSDEEEEDEECFAGEVTEIADDHARVHLDGLCRSDDVWMPISSPKLFMDGGIWDAKKEKEGIPEQHIWEEMDSKRRCVEN